MNNPHFVVLFHQVNYPLATQMTRHLVQAGFTFALLCEDDLKPGESLASRLDNDSRPLLLMVSDNFLKDASCVAQLLPALQSREPGEIQIIVLTEGFPDHADEPVPTRLDRVGQILHYINYWQDQYLQMRKIRPDQITDPQSHELKINQVRKIAFEIGNLIEFLREQQTYSWEALTANHYELFFRKSGNISLHEDFKREHPFLEEDGHLEDRIRESMTIFNDEHDRMIEATDNLTESLSELVAADSPRADEPVSGQEHDLLKKLIAYKNGLEEEPLDDEDDDWDDDDASSDRDAMLSEDLFSEPEDQGGHIIPLSNRDKSHLKRLVENDPENIPARLDLAAMLAEDDQYFNETTQHLEEVLRLDPKNARAFALLGQLSERYNENKLAVRYYEKALESDPTFGPAHLGLGRILSRIDGQAERAIDHLSEARSLMPDHTSVWELYGQVLLDNGRLKKAAKAFKKVLKLDPDREGVKAKIADIYYQLGDRIKAVQYHRDAVDESMQPDTGWPDEPDYPHTIESISPFEEEPATTLKEKEHPPVHARPVKTLTILITGATSGIGQATAEELARAGHRLILTGRREDRLHKLQEGLKNRYGTETFPLSFDIRQEAVTRQMIKALPDAWSNVDILINNAGLASGLAPIHEGDIADWDRMIDTNIKGLLYMTRAVAPGMVARQRGQIINICSTAGKETYPKGNVYCATKFAVEALTRSMRQDLHPYGIRVGQISPGHVEETEFALTRFHGDAEKARIYDDFNPLTSTDVANAILFMINQPPHVNIQDILMMGTQQGSPTMINRSGRIYDQD